MILPLLPTVLAFADRAPTLSRRIAPAWRTTVPYVIYSSARADASRVYLAEDRRIVSLSRRDGSRRWTAALPAARRSTPVRLTLSGSDLLAARFWDGGESGVGTLDVFDLALGRHRGTLAFPGATIEGVRPFGREALVCVRSFYGETVRLGAVSLFGAPSFADEAPPRLLARLGPGLHVFGGELFAVVRPASGEVRAERRRLFDPPTGAGGGVPREIRVAPDGRTAIATNQGWYATASVLGLDPRPSSYFLEEWTTGPVPERRYTLEGARNENGVKLTYPPAVGSRTDRDGWLMDIGGGVSRRAATDAWYLEVDMSLVRLFTVRGVRYVLKHPPGVPSGQRVVLHRLTHAGAMRPVGPLKDNYLAEPGYEHYLFTDAGFVRSTPSRFPVAPRTTQTEWFPLP